MKLTRNQRINNVACMMIAEQRQVSTNHRRFLKDGVPLQAGDGLPETKVSPDELKEALGENLKELETVIEFVLDGKSNQINKGRGKGKT